MTTVVVIESPYSGYILKNVAYAQRAMKDARERKEIVIIPHMTWTQHHLAKGHYVSDWDDKYEIKNGGREASLEQIKVLRRRADKVVFYVDYDYSHGMTDGLEQCKAEGIPYEERRIGGLEQDEANARRRQPPLAKLLGTNVNRGI